MLNKIKAAIIGGLVSLVGFANTTQAEEIQLEYFFADFKHAVILFAGERAGCGELNHEVFQFIIRGAGRHLNERMGMDADAAKKFLTQQGVAIMNSAAAYIKEGGCLYFNGTVEMNKGNFKIIKDAYDIYTPFDKTEPATLKV